LGFINESSSSDEESEAEINQSSVKRMRRGQTSDELIAKEPTPTRPKVDAKRSEAQVCGWED
jgi:hypothetical protein